MLVTIFPNVFNIIFHTIRDNEAWSVDQHMISDYEASAIPSNSISNEVVERYPSEINDNRMKVNNDEVNDNYEESDDDNNDVVGDHNTDEDNDNADDDDDNNIIDDDEIDDDGIDDDETDYDETDNDIDVTSDSETTFNSNQDKNERLPNATELSVMLFFTWKRHNISKAAANDICRIINVFNIPNMPKDFRGIMKHLKGNNRTLLEGNQSFVCPSCGNKCISASKCSFIGCKSPRSTVKAPTQVYVFPLVPQICSILERETIVKSTFTSNEFDDISTSQRYQEIATKEHHINSNRKFVTLTLNSDGVLLKKISRSLWITCACINELPRNKRYDINNILICSISTGDEKPKKEEYATVLQDIVNELKFLEQIGFDVSIPSDVSHDKRLYTHMYAYTIASVCDKPAQALMLNIKDPTGFFSCGWCCIPG